MIDNLMLYNNMIEDEVIRDIVSYSFSDDETFRKRILRNVYRKIGVSPDSCEKYIYDLILSSENEFSLSCEKYGREVIENRFLISVVENDIDVFKELFSFCIKLDRQNEAISELSKFFLKNPNDKIIGCLADTYFRRGCGDLHRSSAYIWDGGLRNVPKPDDVLFDDLIGYNYHKNKIINNTKAFVAGKQFNNVLLFGDRGTGKSSCVKAAFNMFKDQRVRIIEISKSKISQIQDLMQYLGRRGLKFILFMDDLSFEENEYDYKVLKAHLEGGVECQPQNVVIYATSNRMHIVKEAMTDNTGISNEIHLNDVIQEKLSLSERFGITITFDTPSPKDYINIVKELLLREKIKADMNTVQVLAYRWELANHGRSGRSAVQFVKSIIAEIDDDVKV